ncbi:MAG: metalloregulator ArsR/SmtB family transcription factor [Saprospiraceae bacterium]|nr:metalloregulator ArsR/SmtB family transcription factor [Saprospiraceae bacterium]
MRRGILQIDNDQLQVSSDILRALAHPLRMKILEFIDKNKTINVNKIYNSLKIEQSITSQHLKILRASGLVHTHREGKFIHYTIDYPKLVVAVKAIDQFRDFHQEN